MAKQGTFKTNNVLFKVYDFVCKPTSSGVRRDTISGRQDSLRAAWGEVWKEPQLKYRVAQIQETPSSAEKY